MREIRQSGSEGGGVEFKSTLPTPIDSTWTTRCRISRNPAALEDSRLLPVIEEEIGGKPR